MGAKKKHAKPTDKAITEFKIERTADHRVMFSDVQFVRAESGRIAIHFASNDRKLLSSPVIRHPSDKNLVRLSGSPKEELVLREEFVALIPVDKALSMASLIVNKSLELGKDELDRLGVQIEGTALAEALAEKESGKI